MTETRKIELQFLGYQPVTYSLPLDESPFEHIESVDDANDLVESALMGDDGDDGWITSVANGEEFQVRRTI